MTTQGVLPHRPEDSLRRHGKEILSPPSSGQACFPVPRERVAVWGPDYYAKRVILAETMTKACYHRTRRHRIG